MRIDVLEVRNFKKFAERRIEFARPLDAAAEAGSFHVLIGENGSGKTTVLDALAVALGIWLVRVPDSSLATSRRSILPSEKRIELMQTGDRALFQEAAGEVVVKATGRIEDREGVVWQQRIGVGKRKASNSEAKEALEIIAAAYDAAKTGEPIILPVIAYYGAGRAWLPHHERSKAKAKANGPANRWSAFYDCLNERIRLGELSGWFEREALAKGTGNGQYRPGFRAVRHAVLQSIPGASDVWFDGDRKEVVLSMGGQAQPLANLSAGQRTMLALVADIAIKAVTQNNFLVPPDSSAENERAAPLVLQKTPGVVLIDELDVHLHPKWQRLVVESLRTTFPRMQFIVTTHSPFIVQSLRGDELLLLDGQSIPELGNRGIDEIAKGLMGVERPDVGHRYEQMVDAAKSYLLTLEESAKSPPEKLKDFEETLAARIAPYADNPAFQAFLELKRAAKLGPSTNGHSGTTT